MNEDELLASELSKLGASYGQGGGAGAGAAAQFLPTERHHLELELHASPSAILTRVYTFLCDEGQVIDHRSGEPSPYPAIAGVVGSGVWRMNPTILQAEVIKADGERSVVFLTGAAKEGFIKQDSAKKAVNRLAEALKMLGETP